jgi:hypothetical protein
MAWDATPPAVSAPPMKEPLIAKIATIADVTTGKVAATFEMSRSASLHSPDDGAHLMVNFPSGCGSAEPLVIQLPSNPEAARAAAPMDLSEVVFDDVLKRIGKSS